jgi:hypothetical protein
MLNAHGAGRLMCSVMKHKPESASEYCFLGVLAVVQPCIMYPSLRILHWNFILSGVLAAAMAVGAAALCIRSAVD